MIQQIFFPLDWSLSFLASCLRFGAGGAPEQPAETGAPLVLYEFEGCPFCRIAREQVSASGVRVHVKPCPKGGKRFRPDVEARGGKAQFPYLLDPNADGNEPEIAMYESADIARYLRQISGRSKRPLIHWTGPLNHVLSQYSVLLRYLSGTRAKPSASPDQPLLFYAPERSPGGRLVKEMLCSRELEYQWSAVPPAGQSMPFLEDPETGAQLSGALKILNYLRSTYPSQS